MKFAASITALAATLAIAACETPSTDPPDWRDPNAGEAWIRANNIYQDGQASDGGWLLIGFDPAGAYFIRRNLWRFEASSPNTPRIVVRLERFVSEGGLDGAATLSETSDYDFDCTSDVFNLVRTVEYEGRNLIGRGRITNFSEQWSPIAQNPILRSVRQDVCRAVSPRPAFQIPAG
jgi:hypothetical protein